MKNKFTVSKTPYNDSVIVLDSENKAKLLKLLLEDGEEFTVKTDFSLNLIGWVIRNVRILGLHA